MTEPILYPDAGMTPRPDIAANPIFPLLARASLFELHANLLELLRKSLTEREGPKNIVVVGPGAEALPFSEHLEAVTELLKGGNLILLDYNREICDNLPAYLEKMGFGRWFRIERCRDEKIINVTGLSNSIIVMEWDIQDGFPFPAVSVDAIDMTVSMHHITLYESDIETLFVQASDVIKDGGVLHIGEGNVDMKYSERKIRRLARDICAFGVPGVLVSDGRYSGLPPRQWHVGEEDTEATMHISADGMVFIKHVPCETLSAFLSKSGYKQIYITDNLVVLPLIDDTLDEDFQEMIVPVRAYYSAISEVCTKNLDPSHHEKFFRVLCKEQNNAERGIVEYYSLPSKLCEALSRTGFALDEMRYTKNGPFVNILAIKPTTKGF